MMWTFLSPWLVMIVLLVFCALVETVNGNFFGEYYEPKVFGGASHPGPCSASNPCVVATGRDTLPPSVSNIDFCFLRKPGGNTMCHKVKDVLDWADYKIYDLECDAVRVHPDKGLYMNSHGLNATANPPYINADFSVIELSLRCTALVDVNLIAVTVGKTQYVMSFKEASISLNKKTPGLLTMEFPYTHFNWAKGESANHDLPYDVSLEFFDGISSALITNDFTGELKMKNDIFDLLEFCPAHAKVLGDGTRTDARCQITTQSAIGSFFLGILNLIIQMDLLLTTLFNLFKTSVANMFATIFENLFYLDYPNNGKANPGLFNVLWTEARQQLITIGEQTGEDVRLIDPDNAIDAKFPYLAENRPDWRTDAMRLDNSSTFELISVILNRWLGGKTSDGKDLVVNQVFRDAVLDANGEYVSGDLVGYDTLFDAGFSEIHATLVRFKLRGLDTFKNFKVLQNGFTANDLVETQFGRSFINQLNLSYLDLRFVVNLTFDCGLWVKAPRNYGSCDARDSQNYTMEYSMKLNDFDMDLSTNAVMNFDEIDNLVFGQIRRALNYTYFDTFNEFYYAARECFGVAFYNVYFPSMEVSLSSVDKVYLTKNTDFDTGTFNFLDSLSKFISDGTHGALRKIMPGYFQSDIRTLINDDLRDNVVFSGYNDGYSRCPRWVYNGVDLVSVRFDQSPAKEIYTFVGQSLGGEQIIKSDTNINAVLQTLFEYYSEQSDAIWLTPNGPGNWVFKDQYQTRLHGSKFGNSVDNYFEFSNVEILNVDSIDSLVLNEDPLLGAYAVKTQFSLGGPLYEFDENGDLVQIPGENNLTLKFNYKVKTMESLGGVDEYWQFTFTFTKLLFGFTLSDLEFDQNKLDQVRFEFLTHTPCLLQPLFNIKFNDLLRSATYEGVNFDLQHIYSYSLDSETDIVKALYALQASCPGLTDPKERAICDLAAGRVTNLVEGIQKGCLNYVLDSLEDVPITYLGIDYETCASMPDPLSIGTIGLPFTLPNFQAFQDDCLAEIEPIKTVEEYEEQFQPLSVELVDLQGSVIVDVIREIFASATARSRILNGLANSTNTPLSKYFQLRQISPWTNATTVDFVFDLADIGYDIDFSDYIPDFYATGGKVTILDFDKLLSAAVDIFVPLSNSTLSHHLKFSEDDDLYVNVESRIEVSHSVVDRDPENTDVLIEHIDSTFVLKGLDIMFDTVTAIDKVAFGNISLGHLYRVNSSTQEIYLNTWAVDCLLNSIVDNGLFIPYIKVNISDVSVNATVQSRDNLLLTQSVSDFLNAQVRLMVEFWQEAVPNICDNCIKTSLNTWMRDLWVAANNSNACPVFEKIVPPQLNGVDRFYKFNSAPDYIDFQNAYQNYVIGSDDDPGGKYATANLLMKSLLDPPGGLLSEDQGNNIVAVDAPINYNGVSYGSYTMNLRDLSLKYVSVTNAKLLHPLMDDDTTTNTTTNSTALASRSLVGTTPSEYFGILDTADVPYFLSTDLHFENDADAGQGTRIVFAGKLQIDVKELFPEIPDMKNDLGFSVQVEDLKLASDILTEIDLVDAMIVFLNQTQDYRLLPCAFLPVKSLQFLKFNLSVDDLRFGVDCYENCDILGGWGVKPGFSIDSSQNTQLTNAINDFVVWLVDYMHSRGAQDAIDYYIDSAPEYCAIITQRLQSLGTVPPPPTSTDVATILGAGFGGLAFLVAITGLCLIPVHKRRKNKEIENVAAIFSEGNTGMKTFDAKAFANLRVQSICMHPATVIPIKIIIPIVCVMNIGGLLLAFLFLDAASIVAKLTVVGVDTQYISVVPLSVRGTVNDIWNSGAWPLSFLVAATSFAWPITKNIGLMIVWFSPTTLLGYRNRSRILHTMDVFGKWCFLDLFVIIVLLGSLRTYVQANYIKALDFLDPKFLAVELSVVPESGIVIMFVAAVLSLLANYFALAVHDRVASSNDATEDEIRGRLTKGLVPEKAVRKMSLHGYTFSGVTRDGFVRRINPNFSIGLLVVTLAGLACFVIGLFFPLAEFQLNGIVGLILGFIETSNPAIVDNQLRLKEYTVISLGTVLNYIPNNGFLDTLLIVFLQTFYFFTMIICPIACFLLITVILMFKMTLTAQRQVVYWLSIFFYGSTAEVLLLALLLTALEMQKVAAYLLDYVTGSYCSYIKPFIGVIVPNAPIDGYCLDVVGSFDVKGFIFVAGSLSVVFIFYLVFYIANVMISDRNYDSYKEHRADSLPRKLSIIGFKLVMLVTYLDEPNENDDIGNLETTEESETSRYTKTVVSKFGDFLFATKSGDEAAERRVQAWKKKFNVDDTPAESAK